MSVTDSTTKQWEQLYARISPVLFQYGYKITAHRGLIEDCIHDVFTKIWGRPELLAEVRHSKAYLIQVFRHHLFAKLKEEAERRSIHPPTPDFSLTLSQEASWIEKEVNQEQRNRISRALKQLSARQREAVYLKFYENHSCTEVAQIMGLEKSAVYTLVYKALTRLRDSLQSPELSPMLKSSYH